MNTHVYQQLLSKARDAQQGGIEAWSVQSTGERMAVALVLNRADWLAIMGFTLAEAIERTGEEWLRHVPAVARQIGNVG